MPTPTSPASPPLPVQGWASAHRPPAPARTATPPGDGVGIMPVTGDVVAQLASTAAADRFPGREVAVDSYYDEAAGRAVYRVADRRTGEVLVEAPPEELLRFFAAMRTPPGAPLVVLQA
jgi:hypothetical protein